MNVRTGCPGSVDRIDQKSFACLWFSDNLKKYIFNYDYTYLRADKETTREVVVVYC